MDEPVKTEPAMDEDEHYMEDEPVTEYEDMEDEPVTEDDHEAAPEMEEPALEEDEEDLELEAILRELEGEEEETPVTEDEHEAAPEMEEPALEEDEDEIDLEEIIRALREDDHEAAPEKEVAVDEDEDQEPAAELKEAYKVIRFMKSKLNEVNLLNAKLLFSNKLFRNHSLNASQKMKVIENFDRACTLREVKLVFATLSESFKFGKTKKTIKESYASKATRSTKPSRNVLSEGNIMADRFKKLAGLL
jgi:hypothetical protein